MGKVFPCHDVVMSLGPNKPGFKEDAAKHSPTIKQKSINYNANFNLLSLGSSNLKSVIFEQNLEIKSTGNSCEILVR